MYLIWGMTSIHCFKRDSFPESFHHSGENLRDWYKWTCWAYDSHQRASFCCCQGANLSSSFTPNTWGIFVCAIQSHVLLTSCMRSFGCGIVVVFCLENARKILYGLSSRITSLRLKCSCVFPKGKSLLTSISSHEVIKPCMISHRRILFNIIPSLGGS
jgi:hypothetical protein